MRPIPILDPRIHQSVTQIGPGGGDLAETGLIAPFPRFIRAPQFPAIGLQQGRQSGGMPHDLAAGQVSHHQQYDGILAGVQMSGNFDGVVFRAIGLKAGRAAFNIIAIHPQHVTGISKKLNLCDRRPGGEVESFAEGDGHPRLVLRRLGPNHRALQRLTDSIRLDRRKNAQRRPVLRQRITTGNKA